MNKLLLLLTFILVVTSAGFAQTPEANQQARLLALVKDVQAQQAQLAENQAKIEEKLTALSESIRTARIYTQRVR